MFTVTIILTVTAAVFAALSFLLPPAQRSTTRYIAAGVQATALLALALACIVIVPASNAGIQVRLGEVLPETLAEGPHLVPPWVKVKDIYLAQQTVTTKEADASSHDLQSVHASVNVAFTVKPELARDLYVMNPTLSYPELLVVPATEEVFKAVMAQYSAEQLVNRRQEVSEAITKAMQAKLAPYHLQVQTVNLQNFGFSKSFNASIEEKVVASQKAETAKRDLERVKSEADARIAQAEGEAKAIAIQAAAIEKQGGDKYVQLQAISKWDGKLPTTTSSAIPFINLKP